jgi:hypothetical protein
MVKNGHDINQVLDMPYFYFVELLKDENKPRETESLISAFGG